jgi:ribosome-binding ATPase YchF (GTP1/OBG family)
MNLITFYTPGEKESKSYLIERGTTAYQSSKKIHSDIQKGFIRAEIINYNDYKEFFGDKKALKEHGKIRLEGKDYIVKDGDIILFRFNK